MKVIISVITFLFFLISELNAEIITVCNSCKINSIKSAISIANPHDTIKIKKGIYNEFNIVVDKPITIIGEDFPVIDGKNQGEILTIVSDSVKVDAIFLKNVGNSYTEDYAAIRVRKSNYFDIRNLIIEKLFFGIYIEKSNFGKIINNTIKGEAVEEYNSGNGIHLWYSHDIVIENNHVQNMRDGIYLEFADNSTIKKNTSIHNIRYGLHFMFSNNDVYEGNTFQENGAGVAVMFSKHISMIKNRFINNWGSSSYGLLLKEINDAKITGNTFNKNTIGISIEGSNRIDYLNNDFTNNGWALKVRGACYSNKFSNNNFLYNSFDVSYNSNINDNSFDQNYWSNYTGYDLDKNGIGDVPYRPVKLFSYIVNRTPETIILLRSLFIDVIDFSEKVSPVFTPDNLVDNNPLIKKKVW